MARSYLLPGQGYLTETGVSDYMMPGWGVFVAEKIELTSASLLESSDIIAGNVSESTTTASGALVESSDVIAGNVSSSFAFGALQEGSDIISATAKETIVATGALVESSDTVTSLVSIQGVVRSFLIPFFGYYADTSYDDYLVPGWGFIDGSIVPSFSINGVLLESSDIIASTVQVWTARGALVESSDIISATASSQLVTAGALLEDSDIIAGSVSRATTATGALLESSDIIDASAGQRLTASGNLFEGSDHITGFITNAIPTPSIRIMKVYPQPVIFPYAGVDNNAYKTPAEADLYGIDYSLEIDPDILVGAGWESFNGDLTLTNETNSDDVSYAIVGAGTPGTTSQLINLVDTLGQRQIEYTIDINLRQYNFATNKPQVGGASDILDYGLDWTTRITDEAEFITESTWGYDGNDTALNIGYYPPFTFGENLKTGVWLNSGTLGQTYVLTNTVSTNKNRILQSSFIYTVNQPIIVVTPANDYTVEDGSEPYGTEDGSQNYGY